MHRKLVFLDIDGTLTTPGSNEPPKSALEAIRGAREAGHMVFLCSGRNLSMLQPLLKFGFDGAVASSGGYVFTGDQLLFDCPMTSEQQQLAMYLFKENGIFRTVEAKDGSFCDEGLADFLYSSTGGNSELLRWRKALESDLGIRPMAEYDGRPIYKIIFMFGDPKQLEPVRQALEREFAFVIQEQFGAACFNGELVNRRFDKGTGVRAVAKHFGYALEDTIGFGDSMNDLEMIETVGTSVCMANGSEQLKARCNMVVPAVEEDGLAEGFRRLGLLENE